MKVNPQLKLEPDNVHYILLHEISENICTWNFLDMNFISETIKFSL